MVINLRRKLVKVLLLLIMLVFALYGINKLITAFWHWSYPFEYRETIIDNAAKYQIDPLLIAAVIRVESKYNSKAESGRGACGLMQVMPETGAWAAAKIGIKNYHQELLFDPEYNITIGTWYLADLYREFGNNTVIVLAAYNGGRGNVHKWLAKANWSGHAKTIDNIPFSETRKYVQRVMHDYQRYQEIYGSELSGGDG